MKSTIRERRHHRISDSKSDEVEHGATFLKDSKSKGEDKHKKANNNHSLLRYMIALLILSVFISYDKLHPTPYQFESINPSKESVGADGNKNIHATKKLTSFTVDILSVSSITNLDLLHAQQRALLSHISVRNFFNVTELDDADPHCHQDITWDHVKQTSSFCRRKRGKSLNLLTRYFTANYARTQWLEKKKNPTGWLCAQTRPYAGLMKVYEHYKTTGQPLPHYFIIMDDDTFYNMELFQKNFEESDSSKDTFDAGCLIRPPTWQVNITFPFGGFGSILSEGSLSNLFRSIQCPGLVGNFEDTTEDSALCNRLKENNVWELQYFTNGMNLVELMYKYTSTEKYRNISQWTTGFCMHSDWVIGYFANYYNVSNHVREPYYKDVLHARIEAYKGSEIYRAGTGFCKNDQHCRSGSEICHRVSSEWLEKELKQLKLNFPNKFHHAEVGDIGNK